MAFSTIQGTGGAPDTFVGTSGVDFINFAPGTDSAPSNFFLGAQGANDVIQFTGDKTYNLATLRGGDGNDTFLFGNNTLFDGILSGVLINGNVGADSIEIWGTHYSTTIAGGQGDDYIDVDALNGSLVNGNQNADTIAVFGLASSSSVFGGQGADSIQIDAGATSSIVQGNDGKDTITLSGAFASSTINGNAGDDSITIIAGATFDKTTVFGGQGADVIVGNNKSVFISGDEGNDNLTGSSVGDTILGGAGNDTINGAGGADLLTGGAGVDAFLTGAAGGVASTGYVKDTLFSFANGVDVITDFAGGALAGGGETLTSGNAAFVFSTDAIRGDYGNGVFTKSATGADFLVATGAVADLTAASYTAFATSDNATVLLGTGATLVAANLA